MAIYHCSATTISRSHGRSACAAAAYRAAEKITDERTGITHDFTKKGGVIYSEIVAPAESPAWVSARAELWNGAEQAEEVSTRRATATTAREFNIALPHELDRDAQLSSCREFSLYIVTTYGVAVDFSIHEPDKDGDNRNYHGHFMLTDRRITDLGFAGKVRELNIFNGGKANIVSIREKWAEIANRILERAGVHQGIDHRSYKSRGINREATTHLGVAATALERRGEATERGDQNRVAQEINALRSEFEDAGETISTLELIENYDGKEVSEIETGEHVDAAASAGDITPAVMFGRMPDSFSKPIAFSESRKLDQLQTVNEKPKQSMTKMTHEQWIKEAEAKANTSKELRRMLRSDRTKLGRDR